MPKKKLVFYNLTASLLSTERHHCFFNYQMIYYLAVFPLSLHYLLPQTAVCSTVLRHLVQNLQCYCNNFSLLLRVHCRNIAHNFD